MGSGRRSRLLSIRSAQRDLTQWRSGVGSCIRLVEQLTSKTLASQGTSTAKMEVLGKTMMAEPTNVIFMSSFLNKDGVVPSHRCDWRCQNERVFGNMYRCRLTGFTHICDKNCNQRILFDNHSSLCRASGQVFPLSPEEEQAVRGVRRKLEEDNSSEGCSPFKRRRGAQMHPSPFERSFHAVTPICSQIGDGMDMS